MSGFRDDDMHEDDGRYVRMAMQAFVGAHEPSTWSREEAERRQGFLFPLDDVGAFGGMSVVLAGMPDALRPRCEKHPEQPCGWVRGTWTCPREDCDFERPDE
jgi:hypothetical protein